VPALRVIENLPSGRQQNEPAEDGDDAQNVQDTGVRVTVQTKQRRPQMSGIMRERIDARISARNPA
jgi:hypothetical protein